MLELVKNEPIWSSHLDPNTNEVYFFNRKTDEKVFEKPKDYDGHYIIGEGATSKTKSEDIAIYERTFGDFSKKFCTPLELAD